MKRKFLLFLLFLLLPICSIPSYGSRDELEEKMIEAEEILWNRFYSSKTSLFYDYISSYDEGEGLAHLPLLDEVARQYPNPCGFGTGMEDCMISAGIMMHAVLNRYRCDKYKKGPRRAKAIFEGIDRSIQSVPGEGFVARGFSPFAPGLFYINSSRDQVTYAVVAMWEYYRSGLANKRVKARIRRDIKDVADRMQRNVTSENNYDFLCADGSPCHYRICKMENVKPHEAARLAMIYAAAWDMTGEKEYYRLWREKIRSAAEGSLHPDAMTATYGLLQMQESIAMLTTMEKDTALIRMFLEASAEASSLAVSRIQDLDKDKDKYDLTQLAPDWRIAGGIDRPYRMMTFYPRECGEIPLILMKDPNGNFPYQAEELLLDSLETTDFTRHSGNGLFYLLAAWWTWKARQSPA